VLADLLRSPRDGIAFNENFSGDGVTIYKHACGLGCEGIVSKRLGSPYRASRSPHWIKVKNPKAPAVKRSRRGLELSRARSLALMVEKGECRPK
jgi:bifunctional non-homologous end joining protein LigD